MGADFKWRDTMVCVATYNILEASKFMDQFEDADFPFATAGDLKLENLRYFPQLNLSAAMMQALSVEVSRTFLTHLAKNFTSKKQNPVLQSSSIIRAVADVFIDGERTLVDLAKTVDDNFKFPDE